MSQRKSILDYFSSPVKKLKAKSSKVNIKEFINNENLSSKNHEILSSQNNENLFSEINEKLSSEINAGLSSQNNENLSSQINATLSSPIKSDLSKWHNQKQTAYKRVLVEDASQRSAMTSPVSHLSQPVVKTQRFSFLDPPRDSKKRSKCDKDYDPTTLFIDDEVLKTFTAFERQYWEIKKQYFDTVIFFKKGKFYELYEVDAIIGEKFGLKVSGKQENENGRCNMKMAGVPESSYEYWAAKFLENGYKVGRVEQKESVLGRQIRESDLNDKANSSIVESGSLRQTPQKQKIIERELKEIITPSTINNPSLMHGFSSVYLAIIKNRSVILFDASLNLIKIVQKESINNVNELLNTYIIKEIITDSKISTSIPVIQPIKGGSCIRLRDKFNDEDGYQCLIYLMNYLTYLKRPEIINNIRFEKAEIDYMCLRHNTLDNMDIIQQEGTQNTLYNAINHCTTPMGKRKLANWIIHPLTNYSKIKKRQSIAMIFEKTDLSSLLNIFKRIGDFERFLVRLFAQNSTLKDIALFLESLNAIVNFFDGLETLLRQTFSFIEKLDRSKTESSALITEDNHSENIQSDLKTPVATEEEGLIHLYNIICNLPDIKGILRFITTNYEIKEQITPLNDKHTFHALKLELVKLENALVIYKNEQEKKIKCQISYKDNGKELYQLEINADITKIPSEYQMVGKTKTKKRYYTPKLRNYVEQVSILNERLFQISSTLNKEVIFEIKTYEDALFTANGILAEIDCLMSFGIYEKYHPTTTLPVFLNRENHTNHISQVRNPSKEISQENDTKTQTFDESDVFSNCDPDDFILTLQNMGNPIYKTYILNDVVFSKRVIVLTGPNMGGKSTLMRSIALNVILSQMGMKVHCSLMRTKIFYNIQTRIGCSDNLLRGESTFMIELLEMKEIINNNSNSLVFVDELGRGTSSKEGTAISNAVLQFLIENGVYCVFSTHFIQNICNLQFKGLFMKVLIEEGDLIFLYKTTEGITGESYGIEVAKMAGIPDSIIQKAIEYKQNLK